jgi:hypothetical protein
VADLDWTLFSATFVATETVYILGFEDKTALTNGGMVLDDIRVTEVDTSAVPVPTALPLFATGLGVMALAVRRRKKKQAA